MAAHKSDSPTTSDAARSDLANQPGNQPASEANQVLVYRFEDLTRGAASVIRIMCEGTEYSLRRTKAGKLVLNK